MNPETKLEAALVWDQAGHLTEIACTALVDGELELLPDDAVRHAGACVDCSDRIGRAALFAVEIAGELEARGQRAATAPARAAVVPRRHPLPVAALAAALAVALLGVLPMLRGLSEAVSGLRTFAVHALPVYARGTAHALVYARSGGVLALAWVVTAMVLVVAGVVVARRAPQPLRWKGAV